MSRLDVEIHCVTSNYPPEIHGTLYRWVAPDGTVWAESQSQHFITPKQARRLKLKLQAQITYRVYGAWREVQDAALPDGGVLPADATP